MISFKLYTMCALNNINLVPCEASDMPPVLNGVKQYQ